MLYQTMKENEILLFLEECGFGEEALIPHILCKKIFQNETNILFRSSVSSDHFTLLSTIDLGKDNQCYSMLDTKPDDVTDMNQVIKIFTALPILIKTFFDYSEMTNTRLLAKFYKLWPTGYISYSTIDEDGQTRILPTNMLNMPLFTISPIKNQEYFQFHGLGLLISEKIYIDDLFDNKHEGKTINCLKWEKTNINAIHQNEV